MKKIYKLIQVFSFLFLAMGIIAPAFSQQSYTFTNAGATGTAGPNQTQINSAYLSTNLNGSVTVTGGIQSFTIPLNGSYRIEAYGAQGGGSTGGANTGSLGGLGAAMIGDFTLTAGQVLRILVGQQGGTEPYGGGGGGGSFVVLTPTVPMVVAGGGGGGNGYVGYSRGVFAGGCGTTSTTGGNSNQMAGGLGGPAPGIGGGAIATGGTAGYGGGGGVSAGGGGFLNIGGYGSSNLNPGQGFLQGGFGGAGAGTSSLLNMGGFGGGGGGQTSSGYGGGGGGYSGGGAGNWDGVTHGNGGGGGSFNAGSNQTNTACFNAGHGRVIIRELCNISLTSSGTNSLYPSICNGASLTLSTNAVSPYLWFNGNSTNTSIVVSPSVTTTYSITGTSTAACQAMAAITVTVSGGLPVIAIANPSSNICLGRTVSLTATGALTYTWTNPGVVNGQTFTPASTQVYTVTGENGCGIGTATTSIIVAPLPVSVAATPTQVCEGSPALLSAVSAVTSYTWLPVALYGSTVNVVPLVNTIYTVTASDGTCSGTQTVQVTTKTTPTITASTSATMICQGGSVVLSAGGGLSYNWMPGNLSGNSVTVSPSISTLYSLTGTNSVGCSNTANQGVVVVASPTVNIVANKTTVCAGDPVILFASGANTYVWTGGPSTAAYTVNPMTSNVYTVTGTQTGNNCPGTKTIAIAAVISNVSVSSNTSVCEGGSTTLVASGATSYVWNGIPQLGNGNFPVTPVALTVYTVVATTSSNSVNCPVTRTVEVGIFPTPTITIVATKSLICKAMSNTLTATGAVTYTWGAAGSGSVIVVKPNNTTIYTAMGIDANGCEGTQLISVVVNACIGISEQNKTNAGISIYPNPSSGAFIISSDSDIRLTVMNELGQEIRTIQLSSQNDHHVSLSDLAAGIYLIVGENENGKVNQKVIVTK